MRQIELWTAGGEYVATVEIPPFPDHAMWGVRCFVNNKPYPDTLHPEKPWAYNECFAVASVTESPGLPRWEPAPPPPVDRSARTVLGAAVAPGEADTTIGPDGQQRGYVALSAEERAKGFVRPVRRSYVHAKCGAVTSMSAALAETYARDPEFYSGTFCSTCRAHFPVGADGEFVWAGTDQKVGT
jgi:hypothetical protein